MQAWKQCTLLTALLLCTAAVPGTAWADDGIGPFTNGVASANPAEGSILAIEVGVVGATTGRFAG